MAETILIFKKSLAVQCPIRMLQGTDDNSVEIQTATKLLNHINCENMRLYIGFQSRPFVFVAYLLETARANYL